MIVKYKKSMKFGKFVVLAALGSLSVTACGTYQPSYAPTSLRNKITVAETVERLELYVQSSGLNLSARDQDAVSDFIHQYSRSGQGPLYLNIPSNAANGLGVRQAQTAIGQRLAGLGIPAQAIQSGEYQAALGVPAPIVVSFRRLATAPIDCQQGAGLTTTFTNQPYGGFGCSQSANLAAMIDDPRQLLAPYELDNSSMVRRATIMDKYGKGEATSAERPGEQAVQAGSQSSN